MKQLTYSPRGGELSIEEVPAPMSRPGWVLVCTAASVVSAGTERMAIEFARESLLQKARSRPDIVDLVLGKARREGVLAAVQAVRSRLDRPVSPGYSSAGVVLEAGAGVTDLSPGDRVACAGAGYAVHAEIVCVPRNLVARIPEARTNDVDPIDFEQAAFATLGAIAMHGLRLAEPQLGETVAVIGLGLIGMITVQLARAAGCTVLGMDPDEARCQLAQNIGCHAAVPTEQELKSLVGSHTGSTGVDTVILAAATPSDSPVRLAGHVARSRARVIAIGAVGTHIPRNLYYEKELVFQVARSYGPGRYDPEYEENGRDYPIEYVRWAENRNLHSVLNLLAEGKLDMRPLISHRFPITEACRAFDLLMGQSGERFLGIVINYPHQGSQCRVVKLSRPTVRIDLSHQNDNLAIGLLGAGNFAVGTLIPMIRRTLGARLIGVCAASGPSAHYAAKKFGFLYSTTEPQKILQEMEVNTVVIATPHRMHANIVIAALAARKNVFCEKPLCTSESELAEIRRTYEGLAEPKPLLVVGFNRRFAPMALKLNEFLRAQSAPLIIHYRVNAGHVPLKGWLREKDQGGRIIGEVCHFVDFLTFLVGQSPTRLHGRRIAASDGNNGDSVVITLEYADGSVGTITYAADGDKSFSKERIEVFGGGSVGMIDDFRRLELVRSNRRTVVTSRLRQDKGHRGEWEAFANAVKTGIPPFPLDQMLATTLITFRILESLQRCQPVELRFEDFLTACVEGQREEVRSDFCVKQVRSCAPA